MGEEVNKIGFFKKIYLSALKLKEYSKLSKEGLKSAIKYTLKLFLLFGMIYSTIFIIQTNTNVKKLKNYLKENLPQLTYKDNILNVDSEERIILDDEIVKINFGGKIVIDTNIAYNELVNEYKNEKEGIVILTKDKFTTISNGNVKESTYDEVLEKYFAEKPEILDKEVLLELFGKLKYQKFFFAYILAYIIAQSIYIFIYTFIIAMIFNIVCKIKKLDISFSEIYTLGLYATTILTFGNFITIFISNIIGMGLKIIYNIVPIIYLGIAIYISKWITPDMVKK